MTKRRERDDLTVRDVGEFGLIDRLRAALPDDVTAGGALTRGIGDDAAIWQPSSLAPLVISTDSLVEAVHFRLEPGWSDWADLGHKALAVNLSDLAAMGADPALATISLGLRGGERVTDLELGYAAIGALARRAGCLVAGGDIVASPTAVSITVTVIGSASGPAGPLTRAGARPGDVVAVSGTLGASSAGLRLLGLPEDDRRRRATTAATLIDAHLRPEPRLALGRLLRERGATAAMDLSDGLAGDLPKILAASGVSARVDLAMIPVAAAIRALFPDDWRELAIRGGEDYELLFTIPPGRFPALRDAAAGIGAQVTAIGVVLAADGDGPAMEVMTADGHVTAVRAGAFDHFSS